MIMQYPLFYKQFGIRRPQQLITPRVFEPTVFDFPRDAIYHHISHDVDDTAPDGQSVCFTHNPNRIMIEHHQMLIMEKGAPRRNAVIPASLIQPFLRKNKQFKLTKNPAEIVKNNQVLVVYNYGFLQSLYKYTQLPMTAYNVWWNIERTAWMKIKEVTEVSSRQNFVFFDVPEILPSISSLRMFANKVNPALLSHFDTPEKLRVLELWKWLDENERENSVFSGLKLEHLNKINLVIRSSGRWLVLNMGMLEEWRKGTVLPEGVSKPQFAPIQLQKLFVRTLMFVQSQSQTEVPESIPEAVSDTSDIEDSDTELSDIENKASKDLSEQLIAMPAATDQNEDEKEVNIDQLLADVLPDLDKDLDMLEFIEKKSMVERGIHPETKEAISSDSVLPAIDIFKEKTIEESLRDQINDYSEYGLLSASDYRGMLKQAEKFNTSPNPYNGKETVSEFIKIPQEALAIKEEETRLPDQPTVFDKTMLKSSLKVFDRDYVRNILPKDIVGMVSNIQRAGVIVQDYSVETENGVLGGFEIHTLRIKPIDGVSSTVRFRLPKVDEEGSFLSGGNKYRLRKQRCDVPIRKINPHTVALTSYYGKVFINRSVKKADDTLDWFAKQIILLGNDEKQTHIRNVGPANVFDNTFKSPRMYSGLSQFFKSFTAGNFNFVFDHNERLKFFKAPEPGVKGLSQSSQASLIEEDGKYVICGFTDKNEFLLMDYEDQIYRHTETSGKELIGDLYSVCLLDQTQAPVNFAEMKVFGKTIPVGIILGYMIGISRLMDLMKVKPRIVEGRQQVGLKTDEYIVAFKDKKLVFSRKDKLATLVMGGFRDYQKALKNYFLESFDNKNVYLNVLDTFGIGSRYLREVDLLNQLFIDPITRDILIEMKEPTTFQGLLYRGSELLIHDQHPDSQDMSAMRIRGYERFAGAVYKEMVLSVREFKSRNIRGKSHIDMNPYAVWRNIAQDSSVKLVEDINPIQNLKESEEVTYVGEGGRGKDSMTKTSRAYHPSDMGIISEATKDSSDVAVNTYLSADPKFTSLRGLVSTDYDRQKDGVTSLLSTSALVSAGSDHDD